MLPRIVFEQPSLENTIPVGKYQSSSPEAFSLEDDNLILYAGGPSYSFQILQNDPNQKVVTTPVELAHVAQLVSLYVLNTHFLIWFNGLSIGIEFPYQSISLHALQDDNLCLQVISNDILKVLRVNEEADSGANDYDLTVELILRTEELKSEVGVSTLFTRFGLFSTVQEIYGAMSKCSAQHFDLDEEEEDESGNNPGQGGWYTASNGNDADIEIPDSWVNHGDADDLGDSDQPVIEGDAGMDVDIGYGSIAGTVRKNEIDEADPQVKRKRK